MNPVFNMTSLCTFNHKTMTNTSVCSFAKKLSGWFFFNVFFCRCWLTRDSSTMKWTFFSTTFFSYFRRQASNYCFSYCFLDLCSFFFTTSQVLHTNLYATPEMLRFVFYNSFLCTLVTCARLYHRATTVERPKKMHTQFRNLFLKCTFLGAVGGSSSTHK